MANNRATIVANSLRLWKLCKNSVNAPTAAAIQSLLAGGADVNTEFSGFTVLIWSTLNGYLVAVKALLAAEGIDIDMKSSGGTTAFMIACMHARVEIAKELLAAHNKTCNFDINDMISYGRTALMITCKNSHVNVVELLLSIPNINTHT
jgi:ankyrin repeat protein